MEQSVYIITVNWNGWQQTLECLESLFRQRYTAWKVIVCDNGSTDDSLNHIKAWADGYRDATIPNGFPLCDLISPAVPKPIPYIEYHRKEAELGKKEHEPDVPLILIRTGENLGFAGGNNVGLRYLANRSDYDYIWLLNNDTIVHPDALSTLVSKLQQKASYGMCGATIIYQDNTHLIQTRGGSHHLVWLGQTRYIGFLDSIKMPVIEEVIEHKMSCVLGACMLVTKNFIQHVGLLSEDYFLYFEELDWALRAKPHGYKFAYASQAIVYHKEGGTTGGSNLHRSEKTWTADYFEIRNRIVLTRKFYPWALPTVCLSLIITIVNRIRRKKWNRIGMVLRAARDGFRVPLNRAE
ncbi:glycosyltransferase family 2 protein [Candidatus Entotheonella palauensis]|uniref:Glycosyltransferase 2-like domain-containing protein n=1 Tax=Candidatus Entotheonella gemina TaxID=1429439 RepID=W4MEA4_9BACT|nr:glycosyltransferase family 2 protein [Candidatus Entotheonella palauensis]ETX07957.1 MAG: hypothetical protein ETSY2_08145 [Candidatus Entotheonella gemina]